MTTSDGKTWDAQQARNEALIQGSVYMKDRIVSDVLPLHIDIKNTKSLRKKERLAIEALEIQAARTAVKSLASLAEIGELDHLGGGLDLISALTMTLAMADFEKVEYTIENAHTSVGYYSVLAAYGYLDEDIVIKRFRRGLDIPGHVAWLPGGTQLSGGRLGVMVPTAVGQALGKKAVHGEGAWVIVHCGDAGWISGQALNGFNAADLHKAPITFVMHRNGIQLSGANKHIMDKDMRPIVKALGVTLIEIDSLHDVRSLYRAYRKAYELAQQGRPSMIYPKGWQDIELRAFAEKYGITAQTEAFAAKHGVAMDKKVWVPGSLMSHRDVKPMIECVFLVNDLPGGEGHHDGHMKGRKADEVLANPMLQATPEQTKALERLRKQPKRQVVTEARPAPGSPNLILPKAAIDEIKLPGVGEKDSPRTGVEQGYAAVAKTYPDSMFVVSCDLDASTKLGKARKSLKPDHQFEMSIEEQASALMADGLAMSTKRTQLNVFSTFAAFMEGIAREGFEMWRYQRNLTGANEGLNVTLHMSHVGACTGRDHFSGWGLDWVTMSLGYLPYLHRFYAPADARAAFLAVKDLAAHYGGHIICIPRDKVPILAKQDGSGPLWDVHDEWKAVTTFRTYPSAKRAILALGATAFLAEQAAKELNDKGNPTDVYVVNGFPLPGDTLPKIFEKYRGGVVTIEDGIIATRGTGLRGFAAVVAGAAYGTGAPTDHIGIVDPRVAPSEGHMEVWAHFGITKDALVQAVSGL
ncbi:MAG: thiamine pyrophosphate-dependent enzyme [Planctomycetota bacterium]